MQHFAGAAHNQNLWRGSSIWKQKLWGGQLGGQFSKSSDIGGRPPPLPPNENLQTAFESQKRYSGFVCSVIVAVVDWSLGVSLTNAH